MFCRNCGKEVQEGAVVCTNCGFKPMEGNLFCQNCGAQTKPEQEVCVSCGFKLVKIPGSYQKSKVAAGLLGIFLGALGIHKFYLGYNNTRANSSFSHYFNLWIWRVYNWNNWHCRRNYLSY